MKEDSTIIRLFPIHDNAGLYFINARDDGHKNSWWKSLIPKQFNNIKGMLLEDFDARFRGLTAYKNYFGEHATYMMIFYEFYLLWLSIPAIFSLVLWITAQVRGKQSQFNILFAICTCIYLTVMIEMWKRKQAII